MLSLKPLAEKSWQSGPITVGEAQGDRAPLLAARTALKFFIAVVSIVFFLFTLTYLSRSQYSDFEALTAEPWSPLRQPNLLWLNTVWLFFASIFLHAASRDAMRARQNIQLLLLSLAIIFSLLFVVGQGMVWQQLAEQGFVVHSNPANSYFYLLTAMHGLHLLGGLLALLRVVVLMVRENSSSLFVQRLGLCTWYWHYLLLLWLFLFVILTAAPETYDRIAAWCGL